MPLWLILTNRLALSRVSGDKNLAVGEAKRNPRSGPRHSVCAGREAKAERHGRRLFTAYQSLRHYLPWQMTNGRDGDDDGGLAAAALSSATANGVSMAGTDDRHPPRSPKPLGPPSFPPIPESLSPPAPAGRILVMAIGRAACRACPDCPCPTRPAARATAR